MNDQVLMQAPALPSLLWRAWATRSKRPGLTYPQLLTFPVVMAYLCSPACPWPAAGTVHLSNRIEQLAALQVGDEVSVELVTGGLRSHEKGQVFDLDLLIRRADEVVWRGTQSLLRRGVREPAGLPYISGFDNEVSWVRAFEFEAPVNIGRRYARVSGDFNPMHLSRLSARLFGFQRTIAHGLWTQARALAGLLPARRCVMHMPSEPMSEPC
ncbi:MAG: hypothetical protein LW687_06805 [Burkholderiaceae bacterium]|nr:hypothetical protein [Burkholderiaceae bacterium]